MEVGKYIYIEKWEWKRCVLEGERAALRYFKFFFGVEYKKKNDKKNKDRVQRKGRDGRRGGIR